MEQSLRYRPAATEDFSDISSLLEANALPVAGVQEVLGNFTVAIGDNGKIAGVAGFEIYGKSCLLRSIAVEQSYRNLGVGQQLVQLVLRNATAKGAEVCYLLTETASEYFKRFGFVQVSREQVDEGIKTAEEFTVLCNETAVVMSRPLV